MTRAQAYLYDVLMGISGFLAFVLVIEQTVPSLELIRRFPLLVQLFILRTSHHTVGVMGLFTALLLLRFVLPRADGPGVVELETVRATGIDYATLVSDSALVVDLRNATGRAGVTSEKVWKL